MKKIILIQIVILGLIGIQNSVAGTFTSAGAGPAAWNVNTSWTLVSGSDADGIPDGDDDVTIVAGHTITIGATQYARDLTVDGTLKWTASATLLVTGNYNVSSTGIEDNTGVNNCTLQLNTAGKTISVMGTSSTKLTYVINGNHTVLTGSIIDKSSAVVQLNASSALTNLGTVIVSSVNPFAGSSWINGSGSSVTLKNTGFMAGRTFTANAVPNTVIINYTTALIPTTTAGFYNLTIGGLAGTKTLPANTAVGGDLTILSPNILNSNGFDLSVGGNFINNGTFTQGTRTVTFNGTSTISGSTQTSFYNVTITGSLTGHSTNMNVSHDWVNNGTFIHNNGKVTFNGTTAMSGSGTNSFNHVTISGTLTASAANVNVAGNWINNGTFTHNSGTVTFNGTTTISGSTINSFNNLSISGTLIAPAANMNVAGNWANSGTYTHSSGSITFNGTTTLTGSSTTGFRNVTISGTLTGHATSMSVAGNWINNGTFIHNSGNVLFNGTSSISGATTNSFNGVTISGTLTAPTGNMNVAGNWLNNGTFTHNNGTVTFNGTTIMSGSSTNTLNNITIRGPLTAPAANMNIAADWINNGTFSHNSGTITFSGSSTVTGSYTTSFNNLTISGTLTGHPTSMNIAGNWVNNGTFTHNDGTVVFNGTTAMSGSSTNSFKNITISGTLTGPSINMNVNDSWVNNGTYNANSSTITFPGTTTVSGSSTTTFHNIIITSSLTGHTLNMNVNGNYTNNGSYNSNNGTITFNGSGLQTLSGSGSSDFENLILNNTAGATISSGTYALTGFITLTGGTLTNSGGTFTLLSDASRYARIDPISTGCGTCGFAGNFTIQYYFPTRTPAGWADLSSPVSNSTMQDWDDKLLLVYPFIGFDIEDNRPGNSNVMAYDEPSAAYYELSTSTPLTAGQGFEIALTDDGTLTVFSATTLTTSGTPNFGTFDIPLSYTATNGPAYPVGYSGENLVGNPYASAVALSGVTLNHALSTVDVFDYTIDNYKTLTSSDVIAPYQGFWAYAQESGASVTIPESAKSSSTTTAVSRGTGADTHPYLNLTLSSADGSNTMAHTLRVACNENASDGWDTNDHPFRKSLNPKAPSITANAGEAIVSINTFNNNHETYVMPLTVKICIDGKYQIATSGIKNVSDYAVVLLEDKLTHTFINLNNSNDYTFSARTTDSKQRFVLHFSKSSDYTPVSTAIVNNLANEVQILQNSTGNMINFNLSKTENTVISVMDVLGKKIIQNMNIEASNQSINITLPENFHGLYFIAVQSASGKTVKKFVAE